MVLTLERVPLWRHALRRRDVAIALVLAAVSLLCRWPFIVCGETLLHTDECIVGLMAQDIAEGVR